MLKRLLMIAFAAPLLMPAEATARPDVVDFYKANNVTIVVGYTPGGTYDVYARILAKHLGEHIPGNPTVVIQNMPGAGSMNAANYIYSVAKKDGSELAVFARGIPMQPLLDNRGVQFDATKLEWIGSPSSETTVVLAWSKTPFKTIDDAKKSQMTLSASGTGADSVIFPKALNSVLGTKFKLVVGYPGIAEMLQAVERGEVDGNAGTSWSTLAGAKHEWMTDHKVNILAQIGLKKNPALPDAPLVLDLAPTPAGRQVLELFAARQQMAYPFVAPPGTPPDRLKALRDGFDATMNDSGFVADAKKAGYDVDPVKGSELKELVQKIYASPPEVVAKARASVD